MSAGGRPAVGGGSADHVRRRRTIAGAWVAAAATRASRDVTRRWRRCQALDGVSLWFVVIVVIVVIVVVVVVVVVFVVVVVVV